VLAIVVEKMNNGQQTKQAQAIPRIKNDVVDKIHLSRRVQHAVTGLVLILISYVIPPYPIGCMLLSLATAAFYHIHQKRVHDEAWDRWYLKNFGALLRAHEKGEWDVLEEEGEEAVVGETPPTTAAAGKSQQDKRLHKKKNYQNPYKRRRRKVPALPGAFYFLLGCSLCTLLFPATVARTSVLVLSISDPAAGLVGSWFTWKGLNLAWKELLPRSNAPLSEGGPSVAGSFACVFMTIMCTYLYIPSDNSTLALSLHSRVCIGILTAVTEAVGGRHFPVVGSLADDNLLIPLVVGISICWLNTQ